MSDVRFPELPSQKGFLQAKSESASSLPLLPSSIPKYPQPPSEWLRHRVNEPGPTSVLTEEQLSLENRVHTKLQWENQIARHVLTVYASTKAGSNFHASRAMLSYVDTKREASSSTVSAYVLGKDDEIGREIRHRKRVQESGLADSSANGGTNLQEAATIQGSNESHSKSDQLLSRLVCCPPIVDDVPLVGFDDAEENSPFSPVVTSSWTQLDQDADGVVIDNGGMYLDFAKDAAGAQETINTEEGDVVRPPKVSFEARKSTKQNRSKQSKPPAPNRSPSKPWKCSNNLKGEFPNMAPPRLLGREAVIAALEDKKKAETKQKLLAEKPSSPRAVSPGSKFHANEFVIRDRNGETLVVRGAPLCAPIWFTSAGDVYTDWSELPDGEKLQANLTVLYEHRRFKEYMMLLESILLDAWYSMAKAFDNLSVTRRSQSPTRQSVMHVLTNKTNSLKPGIDYDLDYSRPQSRNTTVDPQPRPASSERTVVREDSDPFITVLPKQMESTASVGVMSDVKRVLTRNDIRRLWYRMVLTANAMVVMLVEKKRYEHAYDLLRHCKGWAENDDILPGRKIIELRAYVNDTKAYYYFDRKKPQAAMEHTLKAMEIYDRIGNTTLYASDLLHIAAIQCYTAKFKESHKTIYQFLAMVEDGSLGLAEASSTQLCLVAIAYHNLAVVQIKLQVSDLACKSSQNARKIAQLCLSQSNRWLPVFQRTHEMALDDVKFQLSQRKDLSEMHKKEILELAQALYEPAPPV